MFSPLHFFSLNFTSLCSHHGKYCTTEIHFVPFCFFFAFQHKKLPDASDGTLSRQVDHELGNQAGDTDVSNSIKSGILYLEDSEDKEWKPHFFMLHQNKMFYTEHSPQSDTEDDDEGCYYEKTHLPNCIQPRESSATYEELHFSEPWFHGKLGSKGSEASRVVAQRLLQRYSSLGEGTFLVRESETFVGDYTLSFWAHNKDNHVRIRAKKDDSGNVRYSLIDSIDFDSLFSLITYYRSHKLVSSDFKICLNQSVPPPKAHESYEWYQANCTKARAEEMLCKVHFDGAFLVRPSEQEENCFAITFRAGGQIKHCRIAQEGRLFIVGNSRFESLVALVKHYERNPLYCKVKLSFVVNEDSLRRLGANNSSTSSVTCTASGKLTAAGGNVDSSSNSSLCMSANYIDSSSFDSNCAVSACPPVSAKAIFDYQASRNDELSFPKHAIITNIVKQDKNWWRGDYGGKIRYWFPANYVQELTSLNDNSDGDSNSPFGSLQKGSIEIVNCSVSVLGGPSHKFRIVSPDSNCPIDISAPSEDDLNEWVNKIRETSASVNEKLRQEKKIERDFKIAKEFSSLIVYCRAVPFSFNCKFVLFPFTLLALFY